VLLPEFELDLETLRMRHGDDVLRGHVELGESLATLDPVDAEVSAEREVCRQLPLRDRYFERAATRDDRHTVMLCRHDLATCTSLVGDQPAGHGQLEDGHEMSTLLEMAL
jgi:hypothetical protein